MDLRQEDLAKLVWPDKDPKTSVVEISRYERGKRIPRVETQAALAAALGCQVGDLFAEVQGTPTTPPGDGESTAFGPGDQTGELLKLEPQDFEVWAGEQMMEIAKRALVAVKVLTRERDALLAKLAARDRELEVLRAEINRLVTGSQPISPLADDMPPAAGPVPHKDPSKYLLNDPSGSGGGDPGVI